MKSTDTHGLGRAQWALLAVFAVGFGGPGCSDDSDPDDVGSLCTEGETRECGTEAQLSRIGQCEPGTQTCLGGQWTAGCSGGVAPQQEVCNGIDDNCDGQTDEGLEAPFYIDIDGDGYGDPTVSVTACSAPGGYVRSPADCDDGDAAVNPAAVDTCDLVDNDCDGELDPGCGCTDGTMIPCGSSTVGSCTEGTRRCVGGSWDVCVGAIEPVPEVCNGLDDDCDGETDEGVLQTFYLDADGDGFGALDATTMACAAPSGYSGLSSDCDDSDPTVNPAAAELCDAVDNNCSGANDEGCDCVSGEHRTCGASDPWGGFLTEGACTTGEQLCVGGLWGVCVGHVVPASETCNGIDDDCDGEIDEVVLNTYYSDADHDGYGATAVSTTGCSPPAGYVATPGDCDDSDAATHPGATELCDGVDQNCVAGTTDEPTRTFYQDSDGDFYGNPQSTISACSPLPGYTELSGDCDDSDSAVHPGATEICDGRDNDCDSSTDEAPAALHCAGQYPFAINVSIWSCSGTCEISTCDTGWADCDASLFNGCECSP